MNTAGSHKGKLVPVFGMTCCILPVKNPNERARQTEKQNHRGQIILEYGNEMGERIVSCSCSASACRAGRPPKRYQQIEYTNILNVYIETGMSAPWSRGKSEADKTEFAGRKLTEPLITQNAGVHFESN